MQHAKTSIGQVRTGAASGSGLRLALGGRGLFSNAATVDSCSGRNAGRIQPILGEVGSLFQRA